MISLLPLGACIGSTSYGYDLYNNDVSREVIGDVVSVVLVDPQDYKIMTPGTLAQKYEIHIPLKDEKYTANFYKVHRFIYNHIGLPSTAPGVIKFSRARLETFFKKYI